MFREKKRKEKGWPKRTYLRNLKGNALSWNSRAYILFSFSVAPGDELKSFKFIFGPEEMTEETEE